MRKIIHFDMDYFFAQVEIRDNPSLKDKPVAIGSKDIRRGVLSTCNYIAREYGVRSAMPTYKALELCPKLILVNSNFDKYKKASHEIFKIFYEYTDSVQGISLDEAFLDITHLASNFQEANSIAREIKNKIFQKTGLTGSAGISFNKFLSKISSEINKPDGLFTITPPHIEEKIKNFPVNYISGVGKVTYKKMESFGIKTFEDLLMFSKLDLVNIFGSFGPDLYNYARGIDNRSVSSEYERKSLSVETTFMENVVDPIVLNQSLLELFERLKYRLEKQDENLLKSIFIKIKYFDFKQTTIEKQISELNLKDCQDLLTQKIEDNISPIRLLGIGVRFHVSKQAKGQLELI